MSFAVMSFYKYISNRLYDQSFILCIQIIKIWKRIEVLAPPPPPPPPHPPCRLQRLTIRRAFNCKVFTGCKSEKNIFEVLLTCTHINNDINN